MKLLGKLATIHGKLSKGYGAMPKGAAALRDPFQLILWEQVGYLADDDKRRAAFARLKREVGLSPAKIAGAKSALLVEIARAGGAIAAATRAARMQESAERVISKWDGDLKQALRLPLPQALRELAKFPMIGKPGAEKILLFTRTHPVLALESNGLRVLLRLGYGKEDKRYDKSYASVRAATAAEERADCDWLITLHSLLRRHGQEVCRRTGPECATCTLTRECTYYLQHRSEFAGDRL